MRSELEKEKSKEEQPIIEPDLNMPNIFAADQPSLNVFTDISALKEHSLHYWSEWDLNAARLDFMFSSPIGKYIVFFIRYFS